MQATLIGLALSTSLSAVSAAVVLARATAYRWARPAAVVPAVPPRALTEAGAAGGTSARFVRGAPAPRALPVAVSLNPIAEVHAAVVAAQ